MRINAKVFFKNWKYRLQNHNYFGFQININQTKHEPLTSAFVL